MRRMMLSLLAVVWVSGCASMGPRSIAADIDTMKVAQVEAAAKSIGVQVYWVNFPKKAALN